MGEVPVNPTSIRNFYREAVSAILTDILDTVTAETGRSFYVRVRSGVLHVLELTDQVVLAVHKPAGNLAPFDVTREPGSVSVTRSSKDLRNRVVVYSGQDATVSALAEAEDGGSIGLRGQRQLLVEYDDEDGGSAGQKAQTMLAERNTLSEEIRVTVMGSTSIRSGVALTFDWPDLSGTFRVKAVTHKLGTPYTQDLPLLRLS